MTENALQLAMQQSSGCDCHSGLKAHMSFNVIFDCRANYSLFFYFLIFLTSLVFNPALRSFPSCGSAERASPLCSRSAASVRLSSFVSRLFLV